MLNSLLMLFIQWLVHSKLVKRKLLVSLALLGLPHLKLMI